LSGVWEQVEITLRTFKEMDINISISSRIKPGQVNILIEDFNSYIVKEMIRVKTEDPTTQYILYVTEYLTQAKNNEVTLNCFNKLTTAVRRLFRYEYKYCGDTYMMYRGGDARAKRKSYIRRYLKPILGFFASKAGTSYGNEMMMARRESCLAEVRELFSLCISTTEAVLNGYDTYCDCPLKYLPVFVDELRMQSNRNASQKFPSIIFSGRLTNHRDLISKEIGLNLLNGYPLEAGRAWDVLLDDTNFKVNRLEGEKDTFGAEQALRFGKEIKQCELPSFDVLSSGIYEYTKQDKTAAYEIYIPQAVNWPYSSPNRTILSIESGLIPIDYGEFSDHDVNIVALTATNHQTVSDIIARPLDESYRQLDSRVSDYNDSQKLKVPSVKSAILKLCKKAPKKWNGKDFS
jgi:hypothetical protein